MNSLEPKIIAISQKGNYHYGRKVAENFSFYSSGKPLPINQIQLFGFPDEITSYFHPEKNKQYSRKDIGNILLNKLERELKKVASEKNKEFILVEHENMYGTTRYPERAHLTFKYQLAYNPTKINKEEK